MVSEFGIYWKYFLAQEYSYSPIPSSNIYILHFYILILNAFEII